MGPGSRYWVGVASRDHVKTGEAGGFCQLGHGKEAPVRRLSPGDGIVYYAPRQMMKAGAPVKGFVSIGRVKEGQVYQAEQSPCLHPFRRDVQYFAGRDAPIAHMLEQLSFTAGNKHRGMEMRRGLFEITQQDFTIIAGEMGVLKDVRAGFDL